VTALPAGLAEVPDAQARAVLWVAVLGAVHRAEVDPRTVLDVFAQAWPQETSSAVLARTALALTARVVPMFLPPAERDAALARVAAAADALLERSDSVEGVAGASLAVVAARVWAASGCQVDRLLRWAAGDGIPAALEGDDDFRWVVLRRLASLDALSDSEIEIAAAADRSLAGSLAALGVRAVRPTAAAKEWAWAMLRDDTDLSNYAALAVAGGFWVAPDPELVRPYVAHVGELVAALSSRMGDDAVSRVVSAIHPTRLVDDTTAAASTALLERDDLTHGVRRALVDADHELREALASRRRYDGGRS
jgi:aminopeptidase N